MSIEIVGPKKYQFQDQVCVLVGLMYVEDLQAQLHIEPKDGEDAQLSVLAGADSITLEIQVKGASDKIDMDTLADWMAHFPVRQSCEPLIERVVLDPNRIALVIATGRCDDASSVFQAALDEAGKPHKTGRLRRRDALAFRAGFEKFAIARPDDEPLVAHRRKYIETYISGLKEAVLRQAIHRIRLVELFDGEDVQRERRRLLTEIGLPPDVVSDVLTKLDAIVVSEKRTGNNVLPRFRDLISQNRPTDPLRPTGYLVRGDEDELERVLSKQGFLLLSGCPRVGKTSTARWIAANLQAQGYKAHVVESIDAAQRFLMEPVAEARLALVDDPFGGAHPTEAPARELATLERMLKSLPAHRRLVVAQAEDRLLEVTRMSKVVEINIADASWVPLENKVGNFLADLWTQECGIQKVPSQLAARVRNALVLGELDLEPGCLVHLAVNHTYLPLDCDLKSIERLARQDAASLAAAFRAEGLAPVATALAVGTTPTTAIALTELAFALGSGSPDRPGEANVLGTMVTFGAKSQSIVPPPASAQAFLYETQPTLTHEQDAALDQLEIRRMIETLGGKGHIFTHPFYRAGSEFLVDAATERSAKSALATVARCLFSLSSDTANAAAANLPWLYERLSTPAARDGVITTAIDGMKSMWPDAREKCLQFLARRFSKLTYEQREKVSKGAWNVSAFGRNEIDWSNGRAFIPKPVGRIIETFLFEAPSGAVVEKALADLSDAGQISVSAEAAAEAAEFLSCSPERATAHIIGRLLSFELATLIRAPTTEAWLCRPRENDEVLLARIFDEEQPAIVSRAFKATVGVWWDCTPERRDALRTGLVKMAGSPVAAFILFGHLVKFERRDETGERPPWELFEALMPEVMAYLPVLPTDQAARLFTVMEAAIKHIVPAVVLTIVDAWLIFVKDIATRRPPNDYLLGVITILLDATGKCPDDRASRVASVLSVPGTGARIRIITDLVDRWSDLTAEERQHVMGQLATPSPDANWLRAAAITRCQVPAEVQQAIFPPGITLDSSSEDLVRTLPPDLLKASMRLYATDHPAIEYSASRIFGETVWEPVLEAISADAKHPYFRQALRYLVSSDSRSLSALIASLGKEHAELIFELLLEHVTHSGGDFLPEAWGALLGLDLDDETRDEYFQRMANVAPMAIENFNEIKRWVPEPYLQEFLQQFDHDLNLVELADCLFAKCSDATATANVEEVRQHYVELVRGHPPKHWVTYEYISRKLRHHEAHNDDLLDELERLGREAYSASMEPPGMDFEPLENWFDPRF